MTPEIIFDIIDIIGLLLVGYIIMNDIKRATLKGCNNDFNRLILSYLHPLKWEEAIKKSTEISKKQYNGILNYRNTIINRTMDISELGLDDISLTQELQYRADRRTFARVFGERYLAELEKIIRLELPNISEEELTSIASEVRELQASNSFTISQINFEILTQKYKSLFNENQFSTIIKYPYIQDALVALDDSELKSFKVAFNSYLKKEDLIIEKTEQSEWNFKMEEYIASLMSEQYKQVILEISQLEDEEEQEEFYKLLGYILDKPNYYNIQTLADLKNIGEKKKYVYTKIMSEENISEYPLLTQMSEIEKYRFIGLQHLGFYPSYEMANMFDSTIAESLDDKNSWILNTLSILKKLYAISDETEMKNFVSGLGKDTFVSEEKSLGSLFKILIKTQIEKSMNNNITDISKLPIMKEADKKRLHLEKCKGIIYDATDTNFSFIVSSISPYADQYYKHEKIKNYREYWEKNGLSEVAAYSHLCPRNLTIASLQTANLGFNQISGLTYMCPFDLDSQLGEFTPKANNISFMSTRRLADYQNLTEIDSKRINPNYVPLIKCWGEITNFDQAMKAVHDFSDKTSLIPIVFMDWDKIRYEQAKENLKLISDYQRNLDERMLKHIAQNMVFYQKLDSEIYGHFSFNTNIMSECLGNNSNEFIDYVKRLSLYHLVDNINRHMDYAKENGIKVTLEGLVGEEPSGR